MTTQATESNLTKYKFAQNFILSELANEMNGKKPYFDEDLKRLYKLVCMYFSGNPEFENFSFETKERNFPFSLKKGLLILGTTGRGKTFLLNSFRKYTKLSTPNDYYGSINSTEIEFMFTKLGLEALGKWNYYRYDPQKEEFFYSGSASNHVYIEELGFENAEIKHYGTVIKPLDQVLFQRHKVFEKYGHKTHACSNLSISEMKDFYSQRIYSRIFQMFNIITTQGQDLRLL